jgi:hypothetical protein
MLAISVPALVGYKHGRPEAYLGIKDLVFIHVPESFFELTC